MKLSLARGAMWVHELGLLDVDAQGEVPETDSYPAETVSIDTAYGTVTSLAPPLTFTKLTLPTTDRLVPYGADPRHGRPRPREGHRKPRRPDAYHHSSWDRVTPPAVLERSRAAGFFGSCGR